MGEEGTKEGRHEEIGGDLESLATAIVDSGLKVHRALGPGLLESVYEHCLAREFHLRGIAFTRQVALPVAYEGVILDAAYRIDLLVENRVIIEVKAVEVLTRLHEAQLLTYMKLSSCRLGFLMNFNSALFKDGLRRKVF